MRMNFRLIALLFLIVCAGAPVVDAAESLDSLFDKWGKKPSAERTSVRYTGTFDGKIPGFMFQRGAGNGWTYGTRITCRNISPDNAAALFEAFDNSRAEVGHIIRRESDRACFDESNMLGYACHYDAGSRTASILRVAVEDEICIPSDWSGRDYYDGSIKGQNQQSAATWAAALARLYTEVKYNYVFYDRMKASIDSTYEALMPQIAEVDNNYDACRILERFMASCKDGHTYIYTYAMETPRFSPFTTVKLGDKVYIDAVESSSLDSAGMRRGMELVAVNGIPVLQYADSLLRPGISSSTPQWTDYIMFDNHGLSYGRAGAPLDLTLSDGKKSVNISHTIAGALRDRPRPNKKLDFKVLKDNIGLLVIPDFQTSVVTDMFDNIYDRLLQTDGLIIDIRGNGGGNSGYAEHIARHFSADSIKIGPWSSPMYIPAFASWNNDTRSYDAPSVSIPPIEGKTPYLKPVVILIDRGTFSAAEDFSAMFKGMKRAVFVGEPSGGSTGNGVRVRLNRFVYANICSKHDLAPDGTEFVGTGIIPDISVEETPQSYFRSSVDNATSAALKALRQK